MVVERLELTNFRGFSHLELSFEPDLTVLVGVNGCGKTSVIDALLIGLGLEKFDPMDIRVGTESTTIHTFLGHTEASVTGSLVSGGTSVDVSDTFDGKTAVPIPLVYGVDRGAWDETPSSTRSRQWDASSVSHTDSESVDYRDFFRWFREMEDIENEQLRYDKSSESPLLRVVRESVYRLLPGFSNLRVHRRGAMGDTRPRLTVEKDGTLLLFDALSEGERSLIVMIADIARRLVIAHPDAADPLAEPFLLVIDEIEQHLHPQWQRELPSRLREVFPGAQVILTTHSPIVVSELKPRQLRALRDFELLGASHREGQDVNEILEALFGTPVRKRQTQALIDAADDALDEDEPEQASDSLDALEAQLGSNDPEVVRLRTLQRMLAAQDHDAVTRVGSSVPGRP